MSRVSWSVVGAKTSSCRAGMVDTVGFPDAISNLTGQGGYKNGLLRHIYSERSIVLMD